MFGYFFGHPVYPPVQYVLLYSLTIYLFPQDITIILIYTFTKHDYTCTANYLLNYSYYCVIYMYIRPTHALRDLIGRNYYGYQF